MTCSAPLLLAMLLLAPTTGGVAVVPVSVGEVTPPVEPAQTLGQALAARGLVVLAPAEQRARMQRGGWPTPVDVVSLRRDVTQPVPPDQIQAAVQRLRKAVEAIENDPVADDARVELLRQARLVLARELYNLGFLSTDRQAAEKLQREMFDHLEAAVRADPYVSMPLETFSPEVRRMLDLARRRVGDAPRGVLEVRCEGCDAAVFVDGRDVGRLPTARRHSLPAGRYRVWLERPGCRSRTYRADLPPAGARVDIELDFDCAARPDEGALRFAAGQRIRTGVAAQLGRLLGVDTLILVGQAQQQDGTWLFAARYDLPGAGVVRQGAVRIDSDDGADFEVLAEFLSAGVPRESAEVPFDLPFEGVPSLASVDGAGAGPVSAPTAAAIDDDATAGPSPLLLGGLGAAGAGALALIAGAVGFGIWSSAYGAIDRPPAGADLDKLYETAKLGWNLGWTGSVVGAVALAAGAGLVTWSLLALPDAAPDAAAEAP